MRLPLLIGANPRTANPDNISILIPGRWRIAADGLVDSEVSIKNHIVRLSVGDEINLEVNTGFTVEFIKRGSERVLSVFAERIK